MTIDALIDDVDLSTHKPFGPGKALRFIFYFFVGPLPLDPQVLETGIPKPFRIPTGACD
jgi:hypothetical protein